MFNFLKNILKSFSLLTVETGWVLLVLFFLNSLFCLFLVLFLGGFFFSLCTCCLKVLTAVAVGEDFSVGGNWAGFSERKAHVQLGIFLMPQGGIWCSVFTVHNHGRSWSLW